MAGQVAAAVVFKTRHNDERRRRRQDDEMGMSAQISLVADLFFFDIVAKETNIR
jgi:hypothetical protein